MWCLGLCVLCVCVCVCDACVFTYTHKYTSFICTYRRRQLFYHSHEHTDVPYCTRASRGIHTAHAATLQQASCPHMVTCMHTTSSLSLMPRMVYAFAGYTHSDGAETAAQLVAAGLQALIWKHFKARATRHRRLSEYWALRGSLNVSYFCATCRV